MPTKKYSNYVSSSNKGKSVQKMPGIGQAYGSRLASQGISSASDLHQQYEKFGGNEAKFSSWLSKTSGSNSRWTKECYNAIKAFDGDSHSQSNNNYSYNSYSNQSRWKPLQVEVTYSPPVSYTPSGSNIVKLHAQNDCSQIEKIKEEYSVSSGQNVIFEASVNSDESKPMRVEVPHQPPVSYTPSGSDIVKLQAQTEIIKEENSVSSGQNVTFEASVNSDESKPMRVEVPHQPPVSYTPSGSDIVKLQAQTEIIKEENSVSSGQNVIFEAAVNSGESKPALKGRSLLEPVKLDSIANPVIVNPTNTELNRIKRSLTPVKNIVDERTSPIVQVPPPIKTLKQPPTELDENSAESADNEHKLLKLAPVPINESLPSNSIKITIEIPKNLEALITTSNNSQSTDDPSKKYTSVDSTSKGSERKEEISLKIGSDGFSSFVGNTSAVKCDKQTTKSADELFGQLVGAELMGIKNKVIKAQLKSKIVLLIQGAIEQDEEANV